MADTNLTQAEVDALIAMEKHRSDDTEWTCQLQKISVHPCIHYTKYGVFGPK